jgi:hypothetical protein
MMSTLTISPLMRPYISPAALAPVVLEGCGQTPQAGSFDTALPTVTAPDLVAGFVLSAWWISTWVAYAPCAGLLCHATGCSVREPGIAVSSEKL